MKTRETHLLYSHHFCSIVVKRTTKLQKKSHTLPLLRPFRISIPKAHPRPRAIRAAGWQCGVCALANPIQMPFRVSYIIVVVVVVESLKSYRESYWGGWEILACLCAFYGVYMFVYCHPQPCIWRAGQQSTPTEHPIRTVSVCVCVCLHASYM